MDMGKNRWGRLLSALICFSVLLGQTVFPAFRKELSALGRRTVSGTSVSLEKNNFHEGTLKVKFRLSGCSTKDEASIKLVLSDDGIITNGANSNVTRYVGPSDLNSETTG